ncbi:hypothetical protein Y032_0005g2396 [Ancylostoma ceylanicum]|uniref:Uncharacterized protein n=1 Tax=Ancylostoma ceylanicum TaxID=53326 RepID=A0A016VR33_9BILA|nr:hypothetical protein Y032_0005g2396 [Ancylostoma ceylanicum]
MYAIIQYPKIHRSGTSDSDRLQFEALTTKSSGLLFVRVLDKCSSRLRKRRRLLLAAPPTPLRHWTIWSKRGDSW